ncbi:MAG: alpha/beta hydrolase [Myxococcales bacterium]|nr:alpha/beta hydrolase [Myxococcales bacterium]
MLDGPEIYDRAMRTWLVAAGARSRKIRYRATDELHVLDISGRGALAPVVLLHGFSASGPSQYGALITRLRDRVTRLILPDLPGHGGSAVPRSGLDPAALLDGLTAAMDALLDEPAVMFASSMSGGVAVSYSGRRPHALAGLMLCSPSGAPFTPEELERFQHAFRIRSHGDALAFVDRLSAQPWWRRHAYAWGIRQAFNRTALVALLAELPATRPLAPEDLSTLSLPVHLIWGLADELLPASHLEFFRAHLPAHAVIDTPAHFGHGPFLDHPDELAERLLAFMRRVAG